jgi:tRNA/tmRNA/rRNA uracil-C5-methylase (TrmA/RlmC/RlmD family)
VNLAAQRRLKASVVSEQLRRLAGVDVDVVVEAVPGDDEGLGWRTRVQYAVDAAGRAGLRPHRRHDVLPIDRCRIAHPLVQAADVTGRLWPGRSAVEVAASAPSGKVLVLPEPPRPHEKPGHLTEQAGGRQWRVSGSGFWQVHPGAADALLDAVLELAAPLHGEVTLDLYAGVGLFAAGLASHVGSAGRVVAVEADPRACRDARRNLHDVRNVEIVEAKVDRWIGSAAAPSGVDVVVLDPPRAGAGRPVVQGIAGLSPRCVVYVACDPAALARDVGTFRELSYDLVSLRAFDLFPMTHHVECVALLEPTLAPPSSRRS